MFGQIITVVEGEKLKKSFPIRNIRTCIGREKVCEIRLDHPDIALQHCLILVSESGFPATIQNLCENKPALLNGGIIVPSGCQLKEGDKITIGPRELEWSYNKRSLPSVWMDVKSGGTAVKRTRSAEPIHKQRLVAVVSPHRNDERDLPPKKRRKTLFPNITSSSSSTSSSGSGPSHHHVVNNTNHTQEFNYSSVLDVSRRTIDTSRSNDLTPGNSLLNRPNCSCISSGTNPQTVTSRIPLRIGQNSRSRSITATSQGTLRPPRVNFDDLSASRANRSVQNQSISNSSRLLRASPLEIDARVQNSTSANTSVSRSGNIVRIRTPHNISIINGIAISVTPISKRTYKEAIDGTKRFPFVYLDKARFRSTSTASSSESREAQPSTSNDSPHSRKITQCILKKLKGRKYHSEISGNREVQPNTSNNSPKTTELILKKLKGRKFDTEMTGNREVQPNTSASTSNGTKKMPKIRPDTRKIPFYIMRKKRGKLTDSELYTSDSGEDLVSLASNESPNSGNIPHCGADKISTEAGEPQQNPSASTSNESRNLQSDTKKIPFYIKRKTRGNVSDSLLFTDDGTEELQKKGNTSKSPSSSSSSKFGSPDTYHTPQKEIQRKISSLTDKSKKKSSSITKRLSSAVKKPSLRLKSSRKCDSLRVLPDDTSPQSSSYVTTRSTDSSMTSSISETCVNLAGNILPESSFNLAGNKIQETLVTTNQENNIAEDTVSSRTLPVTPPNDGKFQILMRSSKRESFRRKIFNRSLAENTLQNSPKTNNTLSPVGNSVKFDLSAAKTGESSTIQTTPTYKGSPKTIMRSSKKESLKKLPLVKENAQNDTPLKAQNPLHSKLSFEFSGRNIKQTNMEDGSSEFENLLDSPITSSKLSVMSFGSSEVTTPSRGTQQKLSSTLRSTSAIKTYQQSSSSSKTLNNSQKLCRSLIEKLDKTEIKQKSRANSKEIISLNTNRNLDNSVNDSLKKVDSSKESMSNLPKSPKKYLRNGNASKCDGTHILPVPSTNSSLSHERNKSGALKSCQLLLTPNNSNSGVIKTLSRKSTFETPRSQKRTRTQMKSSLKKIITSTPRTVGKTPTSIVWNLLDDVVSNTSNDSVCSSPKLNRCSQIGIVNESDVSTSNASMLCDSLKTSVKKLQWDNEISQEGSCSRNGSDNLSKVNVNFDSPASNSSAKHNYPCRSQINVTETNESHPRRSNSLSSLNSQNKKETPRQSKKSTSLISVNSLKIEKTLNPKTGCKRRSKSLSSVNTPTKHKRSTRSTSFRTSVTETPEQSKKSINTSSVKSQQNTKTSQPKRSCNSSIEVETPRQSKKSTSLISVNSLKIEETLHLETISKRSKSLSSVKIPIEHRRSTRSSFRISVTNTPEQTKKGINLSSVKSTKTPQPKSSSNSPTEVETPRQSKQSTSLLSPVNSLKVEETLHPKISDSLSIVNTQEKGSRRSNSLSSLKSPTNHKKSTSFRTSLTKTPEQSMESINLSSVKSQPRRSSNLPIKVETPQQSKKNTSSSSSVSFQKEESTPRRSSRTKSLASSVNSPKLENTPQLNLTPQQPNENTSLSSSLKSKKKSETQFEPSKNETPTSSQTNVPRKRIFSSSSESNTLKVKTAQRVLSKSTSELTKTKKGTSKVSRNKSISQISVVKNNSNRKNAGSKNINKKISGTNRSSVTSLNSKIRKSVKLTKKSKTPAKVNTPTSAKNSVKKVGSNQLNKKASSPKKSHININRHKNCLTAVKTFAKPKVVRTFSHPATGLKNASNSKKLIKTSLTKNVIKKSPTKRTSSPKTKILKVKLHSSMSKSQTSKGNNSKKPTRNTLPSKLPLNKKPSFVTKKPVKSPRVSSKIATNIKSNICTPSTSKKVIVTPKNTIKLNPVARSSRKLAEKSILSTPTSTPKCAFPTARKALTEHKPEKLAASVLKRKLDALCLEKSRAAAKKLKAEPAKSLDKKKVAALLLCHKKKSPVKEANNGRQLYSDIVKKNIAQSSGGIVSTSNDEKSVKTPYQFTTPKIKKLKFASVNEATPSNLAIINRIKTPGKKKESIEDNTSVDSFAESDLKLEESREETFRENDIFSALYLSRKTSTPTQGVEKPLRRLRSTVKKMRTSRSSEFTPNFNNSKKHVLFATPIADYSSGPVKQSAPVDSPIANVSCLKKNISPLVGAEINSLLSANTSDADFDNVSGVKDISRTPPQPDCTYSSGLKRTFQVSPRADYENVSGIKNTLHLSPQADYTNVSGMKKVLHLSPQPDYSNVSCLKRNLELSPQADYTNVAGVKGILELKPIPDYSNVSCMKRVFTTSPVANYTDVTGVKQIFTVPPTADYINTRGLKELRPASEYLNLSGVRELFKESSKVALTEAVNELQVFPVAVASDESKPSTSTNSRKRGRRTPEDAHEPAPVRQLRSRQAKSVVTTTSNKKKTTRSAQPAEEPSNELPKSSTEENENRDLPSSTSENKAETEPSTSNVAVRKTRARKSNDNVEAVKESSRQFRSRLAKSEPPDQKKVEKPVPAVIKKVVQPSTSAVPLIPDLPTVVPKEEITIKSEVPKAVRRGRSANTVSTKEVDTNSRKNSKKVEITIKKENPGPSSSKQADKVSADEQSTDKPRGRKRVQPQETVEPSTLEENKPDINLVKKENHDASSTKQTSKKETSSDKPKRKVAAKKSTKRATAVVKQQTVKAARKSVDTNNAVASTSLEPEKPTRRNTRSQPSVAAKKSTKRATVVVKQQTVKAARKSVDTKNAVASTSLEPKIPTRRNTRSHPSMVKVNNEQVETAGSTKKTTRSNIAKAEPKVKRRSSKILLNKSGVKLVSSIRNAKTAKGAKKKVVQFDRSYSRHSTNNKQARTK